MSYDTVFDVMNTTTIFNIPIDDLTREQVDQHIDDAIHSHRSTWIATVNPEILLYAHNNPSYATVLQKATYRIPDGVGLRLVSSIQSVVPGVDIAEHLLRRAEQGRLRVVCIVRQGGRSSLEQVLDSVQHRAPQAQCRGVALSVHQIDHVGIVKTISEFQPDIVFVGLGFPYQEEWLARNFSSIRSAIIGIGIGGTFDYWTGAAPRAPKWIQRFGVEWLWRLIHHPRRIGRIFNAVLIFPFVAWIDRLGLKKRTER